ncbi:MAG: phosphatidylserine/phosphatidylglycerophosphate/cardiolipin synthase family protein [Bacteriovoracaceae bacterium]|nr:phosphatidylserine/phosphatidylglycerophosphate/cardiolipin synthase family protein [Bacteriovoracaceae bacterium]
MKILILFICFLITTGVQADQIRLLRDDRDALQARVDIIQEAKKEILVEYFSVWNDDQSIGVMALLMAAAKRGVKVKVILDALSSDVPLKTFAALIDEGKDSEGNQNLEIKVYNPLSLNLFKATHRDHAKMIIVDGEIIITGGRNVGDKYFGINRKRNFSDLDLMATGAVAGSAWQNFMETWESKTTKHMKLSKYSPARLEEGSCSRHGPKDTSFDRCENGRRVAKRNIENEKARIHAILEDILLVEDDDLVYSFTGWDWFEHSYENNNLRFISHGTADLVSKETAYMNDALMDIISNAQYDVNIISPYLIPTENLVKIFKVLLEKNVRIRIITNSLRSTDNLFAQAGYREMKPLLIKMGVEIYEYNGPDTIHAKTGLIDNKIAFIGTYNIDPRSAFINREIGVIINDFEQSGFTENLSDTIETFRLNAILVGKDGNTYNQEYEMEGVSRFKKAILKSISYILPWIRHQL